MAESKRRSGAFAQNTEDQAGKPGNSRTVPAPEKMPVSTFDGEYDELDYRLMATFPASDATAQY